MTKTTVPASARLLARVLVPREERQEVLRDLAEEHASRVASAGRVRARLWLWRQVAGSAVMLAGRTWWRGRTGFTPSSDRLHGGGSMLETWVVDARWGIRRLVRRPAYAVLVAITLALGVGGSAAVFGIVRSVLLEPLPYGEAERLVAWWMPGNWSAEELAFMRPAPPGHERIAMYQRAPLTLRVEGAPTRMVEGVWASAELFAVLGVRPLVGVGFQPGDDAPGAAPVAVISHGLWRELGGLPDVVGSAIVVNGVARTVVGVMPERFWFPDRAARVWVPPTIDPGNGAGRYAVVGRLEDGVGLETMGGPLARLTASLAERFDYAEAWDNSRDAVLTPLRDSLLGPVRPALLATLGGMALILLIACANVAALMVVQVTGRRSELGTRAALGAGRGRLMQQIVSEALVVGVLAGAAGAVLAVAAYDVLAAALPLGPLLGDASLDGTVVAVAFAVGMAASLVVAAVPGWAVWHGDVRAALATGRTGGVGGGGRLEGGLVVAEVALAVVLVGGAALLIRSVSNLLALDPGVDTEGIAVVDVILPRGPSLDRPQAQTVAQIERELAALPGVAVVGATQKLALRGSGDNWGFSIPGRSDLAGVWTAFRVVTPGYFRAVGIERVRGRVFEEADRSSDERLVVINDAMAERFFPGEDPVGRVIATGFDTPERIIGVVETVAESALTDEPAPARYMLYEHVGTQAFTTFVLRTGRTRAAAVLDPARRTIERVAPDAAVQRTVRMETVFDEAVGPALRVRTLIGVLAALALVLGAVGVYGVVSHHVQRRRRDWSIRLALGLQPHRIVAHVMGRSTALVAAGAAVGVLGALVLARLLQSFLYGVAATDALALLSGAAVMLAVGAAAAAIPGLRAARTDPATVLKES